MRDMRKQSVLSDIGIALLPPIVVEVLHELQQVFLPDWHTADIPLHFMGGVAIAWMALILWQRWHARRWIPAIPSWLLAWTVFGTVALFGIFWEFYEWLSDQYLGTITQPSLADTMGDFFMDLLGGLLFIVLFQRLFLRHKK